MAKGQSSLTDDDECGNMSSFTFPCRGVRNVGSQQSGRVVDGGDEGGSVNVSVRRRVKVSEPQLADCCNELEDDEPAK